MFARPNANTVVRARATMCIYAKISCFANDSSGEESLKPGRAFASEIIDQVQQTNVDQETMAIYGLYQREGDLGDWKCH